MRYLAARHDPRRVVFVDGWTGKGAITREFTDAVDLVNKELLLGDRGFDPEQIERSLAIDLDSGKLLRGGSTISQQLVKNVFLGPERTLARKLQEAVLTWRMEARLDKKVILERYLDLIELGEGVRGVGAAARYWFARPAEKLSVRQAAFLAALTPAPRTFSRMVRASGGLAPEVADRVDIVLRAMRVAGVIDRATMERARREPLHLAPAALGRR